MFQLSFSAPQDFVISLKPEGQCEEQWYIFSGDHLLVNLEKKSLPDIVPFSLQSKLFIGTHEQKHLYAASFSGSEEAPAGWIWSDLRTLHGVLNERQFSLAGRALQLIDWERTNKYCGSCGSLTQHRDNERCLECPACGHLSYPKYAPAIMALVRRENKILLARGPHFPHKMYSVLAGYVEPGETLEQCVVREVFEEVGLQVNNIRYFGSQPWPFSRSLMIAFSCDWQAGEIHTDSSEIEDAAWFEKSHLPNLPPQLSIARILIDSVTY